VPGGLLVSQSAGGANLWHLRERVARLCQDPSLRECEPFLGFVQPAHAAMPDEARAALEEAGFADVRTWLEAAPVRMSDAASYEEFVSGIVFREELARLPGEVRGAFLGRLVELAAGDDPPFELDYWRLNLDAVRS
jgi:hypothetical protein